ncbi:DUF1573 domain-containing protein [Viscerimonas tarda]
MPIKVIILFLISLLLISCSYSPKHDKLKEIVSEWTNKTVKFPNSILCSFLSRDTVCPDLSATPYKILVYTDSTGCTSCKLRLYNWQAIMHEADSLLPNKLNFLFYFHPKDTKELKFLLRRDKLTYPVFIDERNQIDSLNHFPKQQQYQCFLLDKENKVVAMGNPTMNPKIWELYKSIIQGDTTATNNLKITTVEPQATEIDLTDLRKGQTSKTSFFLKNTGKQPLVINHVDTSCGCTVPSWEKQPVKPSETTEIKVEITPATTGYFQKTITVYCNIENNFVHLSIKGTAGN